MADLDAGATGTMRSADVTRDPLPDDHALPGLKKTFSNFLDLESR
jgi:hypothetical protein